MSHIHLADGVLPAWLWLSGYALTIILIALLWRGQTVHEPRKFALLGIFAAVMVLVALIEFPPFGYHFNLSIVTGIILGPQLAVLAALVVNIVLALIGHGGITVVGLNTLILSTEMIVGYYLFRVLRKTLRPFSAGFVTSMIGLVFGAALGFGFIAIGSPWINKELQNPHANVGEHITGPTLDLGRLAWIIFGVGLLGWIAESLLSAVILRSLERLMPDVISEE